MASMSRTSTVVNSEFTMSDLKRSSSAIDLLPLEIKKSPSCLNMNMLPPEVQFLTPTNTSTTKLSEPAKSSNLKELFWLYELLTSNVSLIAISSIMTALLYHAFSSVSSGVSDICFNSTACAPQAPSSLPFPEEASSSSSELLQWAEMLTPAIAPTLNKIWNFILFPLAPIAFSVVIAIKTEQIKGWKSGHLSMLETDLAEEMKTFESVAEAKPLFEGFPFSTERPIITERRGSFMVEYCDLPEEPQTEHTRFPAVSERRGSFMVTYNEDEDEE